MKQETAQGPIRFGVFEFDPGTGELRKNGFKLKLQGQPLQVLQVLLERPGQVLTRQELRQSIWPADTFVDFDHGLYNAIQKLREALGDSADRPRYVETLARRGYRFIGTVNGNSTVQATPAIEIPQATPGPTTTRTSTTRTSKPSFAVLLGTAVLVLILALTLGLRTIRRREVLPASAAVVMVNSLAVLPFQNLSRDPAQDYLADGMTDVLTNDLSQISELKVISRTSAMRYKNTDKSLPQIARELNVNTVVEGMVLPSGNRVRITAELVQGATDQHLWASSYERNIQDVLALQGDIAQAIAAEVRVKLTPQEQVRLSRASPLNLEAINAYLQGRYHYQKARGMAARRGVYKPREDEKRLALEYFQKAIAENPNYAPAYVSMAEILGVASFFPYPSRSDEQAAKRALQKALEIDPMLAEAHVNLGRIELREWHLAEAGQEFKRAIELNPNLAKAHALYTEYLDAVGQSEEAMKEAEITKTLNPGDDTFTWRFYVRRHYDRFIELKTNDIEINAFGPIDHLYVGEAYERTHKYPEAVKEWEQAMAGLGYNDLADALRRGYAAGGFKGAMRSWVAGWEALSRRGELVHPETVAYIYAVLGEKDRAFAWLEKACDEHTMGMPFLKVDPTWDDIRSDPRFVDLQRRIGLSE